MLFKCLIFRASFSLHSQTQFYVKDIFCMLLVIKHIPVGDAWKVFHLCEVPVV